MLIVIVTQGRKNLITIKARMLVSLPGINRETAGCKIQTFHRLRKNEVGKTIVRTQLYQ